MRQNLLNGHVHDNSRLEADKNHTQRQVIKLHFLTFCAWT